ncbi:metacaspase-2-like [Vespula pensylvanica]|uniref:metacaspase-2-like n=1 Tax=Vespula pensylvanica TaxID=30213 RepID=UPI001CBA155A|nr:metacaspase-2-like [Vespula pensylvanica]
MYDYFNMSCLDDKSALKLNIKVNSENLLPIPQKYNVGSLRVPEDPSWPKIPPRKLVDDADDIIHPPCVITLTGTPRRSRTTVRIPQHQSFKTMEMKDFNSSVHQLTLNTIKRKPGSLDPRFKRVTAVKNQTTPTESIKQYNTSKEPPQSASIIKQSQSPCEMMKKTASGKNLNIYQITQESIKEPENEEIKNNNSHFIQELNRDKSNVEDNNKLECKLHLIKDHNTNNFTNINNTSKIDSVDIKENIDPIPEKTKNIIENEISKGEQISTSTYNEKCILETKTKNDLKVLSENQSLQSSNECDGQILLVMKKKVHSLPSPIPQYTTQCYNVQVPIITYQNIPLQISTCTSGDVNISPCITNTLPITDLCTTTQFKIKHKNSDIHSLSLEKQNLGSLQQEHEIVNTNNVDTTDTQVRQKALILDKKIEDRTSEQPIVENNYYETSSLPNNDKIYISVDNNNDFNRSNNHLKITSHQQPIKINDSNAYISTKVPNFKKCTLNQRRKMRSEQNLLHKENIYIKKFFQSSEPYITSRRRRIKANFSKKARLYFQKKSRSGIINSNCTLLWPGYQKTNCKHGQRFPKVEQYTKEKNCHYLMLKKPIDERNKDINTNCIKMESLVENPTASCDVFCQQNEENKYNSLQRSDKNTSIDNPIRISLKTQELLNKSYLEYYNNLKQKTGNIENIQQKYFHKVALETPYIKRRKNKSFYNNIYNDEVKFNPEMHTIEQCSALSSIINKNLDSTLQHSSDTTQTKQLYVNRNIRQSLDPTGGTQNKTVQNMVSKIATDIYENSVTSSTFIHKIKHKKEKCNEKRFIKLKTIVFFGTIMYALVVFLPMIYDYFFYEDYDDYEDFTYIELIINYVISSFKEAFNSFFNTFYKIFFQPRACKKCNSIS